MSNYKMGKNIHMWKEGLFHSIEFVVTQECNMRCKYCYMVDKNNENIMSFETAKQAIDILIQDEELFLHDSLSINFIGGEPLLEIDLIDEICDYFKIALYENNHKWFNMFRISIGTNGVLYENPKVQKFLFKNKDHVGFNITIDGTKEKHDLQRVYSNGKGTFDDVFRNVQLWMQQTYKPITKVTIGHDDLSHIKESITYLWNLGLKEIPANVVFENVWEEGDDTIFYSQLKELADYIIENKMWNDYNTTLFSETLGTPLKEEQLKGSQCGSGGMITVDAKGVFYPCVRFIDYSLVKQKCIKIGNYTDGLDFERLRAFENCDLEHLSDEECLNCDVASGCGYCLAYNYDQSDNGTIFQRNKNICKMHKSRVRANNYYWARFENTTQKPDETKAYYKKNLFMLLSDQSTEFCNYQAMGNKVIDSFHLVAAANFTEKNFYNPIIVHSDDYDLSKHALSKFNNQRYFNIFSTATSEKLLNDKSILRKIVSLSHKDIVNGHSIFSDSVILLVDKDNMKFMSNDVQKLLNMCKRINIILKSDYMDIDYSLYQSELNKIVDILCDFLTKKEIRHVDVITDSLFYDVWNNCGSGINSFTLAPNGYIYICPSSYYNNPLEHIGHIEKEIINSKTKHYNVHSSLICNSCEMVQCKRCIVYNKILTGEYNTPSLKQCKKSIIERKASHKLYEVIKGEKLYNGLINEINAVKSTDPLLNLPDVGTKLHTYKIASLYNKI